MSAPDFTSVHRRSKGELPALQTLIRDLDLDGRFTGDACLTGADPIIQSPHRLGEASATAQLLIGAAGAAVWQTRTGRTTDIVIDIVDAMHFLHPTHYIMQSGHSMNVGAEHVAINQTFACADGEYIMLHAGPPYAKLLNGYLNFFDCGNNRESLGREVAKWKSAELEEALSAQGLPACVARTREQWRTHPQGALLARTPVIEIEKIGDGAPAVFTTSMRDGAPLDGIRVLDFTHVLAGPRSTRTLAEYGAQVLHVSSPGRRDTVAQHLGVDIGKRNTYLDLAEDADLATMRQLAASADVFATSYRPTANERFGLTPPELARSSQRGIVCITVNAYGHHGPWANRPGFDQNGQVATGFARTEGGDGPPKFSPVFYLADLMTGYFAAAGTMAALLRRATEGGSYHVKVSLSRSTMWVQDLGLLGTSAQAEIPATDTYPAKTVTFPTPYGQITQLAEPLTFSDLRLAAATRLSPYGADPAEWR